MPQIFHPSFNTLAKASIVGLLLLTVLVAWALGIIWRSPYITAERVVIMQPIPFSHEHHVGRLGFDCRYCHTSVEESAFAGMPSTEICMNCHSQIWVGSDMLRPVRESYRTGKPIEWPKVYNLPDFTYFDHSVHVAKGVGCVECHGRVDRMPLLWQATPLTMEWCLECHRDPKPHIRPREAVFDMAWQPPPDADQLRERLMKEYDVRSETSCSICHR